MRLMVSFLSNLSIGRKLSLLVWLLLIPTSLLTWIYVKQTDISVDFADKELLGAEYLHEIYPLHMAMGIHRSTSMRAMVGEAVAASEIAAIKQDIEKAFQALTEVDARLGEVMVTEDRVAKLKQKWQTITAQDTRDPSEIFNAHNALVDDITALITQIANQSNLILDPDLDSFYLMDVEIAALPELINQLGKVRALTSIIAAKGNADAVQLRTLIVLQNAIDAALSRTTSGIQTAYDSTKNQAALAPLKNLSEQLTAQVSLVKAVADQQLEGKFEGSGQTVFDRGIQASQLSQSLLTTCEPELQRLLSLRIDGFISERDKNLAFVLVVLIVALLLSIWLVRLIRHELSRVLQIFGAIEQGDYDKQLSSISRDEIGQAQTALMNLQGVLKQNIEQISTVARESGRIKLALDSCSATVMLVNTRLEVIYVNSAMQQHLLEFATQIKSLCKFNPDLPLTEKVYAFHAQPELLRHKLEKLHATQSERMQLGDRTYDITMSPVVDEQGTRTGIVLEYTDLTDEVAARAREDAANREATLIANENARIRQALDNVSTNTMIADTDHNIIYMNDAVRQLMRKYENNFRQVAPQFNVNGLIGTQMDVFHTDSVQIRNVVKNLKEMYRTEMKVGNATFTLALNPIFTQAGERIGSVMEWGDRTNEVVIEEEIKQIVVAAARGDFSQKITVDRNQGFFKVLGESLNQLTGAVDLVVRDATRMFAALSVGDLSQRIERDYQGAFQTLKQDANATSEKMREVIGAIHNATETINSGAKEIANGNHDLSQRTEQQAASLEETASSVEEMTVSVKASSSNAQKVNGLAQEARARAISGGEVMEKAVEAMDSISKSSKDIADIIGVIDAIAFQTNLLALNAAVEAARAGEQGRGFAVVASEVRSLAQRSATAAKQIKDLINDSAQRVTQGTTLVHLSGTSLKEIVATVDQVSRMMKEIADAATAQSTGIEQINVVISQLDEVTQQNAALVEQATAASAQMSDQAMEMERIVGFFKV